MAVHTTCYEHNTKIMGLKAANAYWNPLYYDPFRITITKPLLFINYKQLAKELRTLIWLSEVLNISLILPNLLGPDHIKTVPTYSNRILWPGFRLAYISHSDNIRSTIVEPSYYWRVQRDFAKVPNPYILSLDASRTVNEVRDAIQNIIQFKKYTRIILHFKSNTYTNTNESIKELNQRLTKWSQDSVGIWDTYNIEKKRYETTPALIIDGDDEINKSKRKIIANVRPCIKIFGQMRGNRSCFDKCD